MFFTGGFNNVHALVKGTVQNRLGGAAVMYKQMLGKQCRLS